MLGIHGRLRKISIVLDSFLSLPSLDCWVSWSCFYSWFRFVISQRVMALGI